MFLVPKSPTLSIHVLVNINESLLVVLSGQVEIITSLLHLNILCLFVESFLDISCLNGWGSKFSGCIFVVDLFPYRIFVQFLMVVRTVCSKS